MNWPLVVALSLLVVGMALSAFFSGIETGFYRVTKLRIVIDARSGDRIARWLWWIVNRPAMFVATTLAGNNIANYLVSLGTILAVESLFDSSGHELTELLLPPIVLAPFVFIYGELLPKRLFFEAPNRLLRIFAPFYFVASIVLAVPTALLWIVGQLLQKIVGRAPGKLNLALARAELAQLFDEGHDAGVLRPAQRALAQGLLAMAERQTVQLATPLGRVPRVRLGASKADVLRLAHRHRLANIVVEEPLGRRRPIGYIAVVDLYLQASGDSLPVREIPEVRAADSPLGALIRLSATQQPLARVVDADGQVVAIVTVEQLAAPMMRGV